MPLHILLCIVHYELCIIKNMAKIKTIGVLTSGGDAPGMNAAIRAVTRATAGIADW